MTELITHTKFNSLYDMLLEDIPLTKENLSSIGITDEEIDVLTGISILEYNDNKKIYDFIDHDRIFRYGKYQIIKNEYDKAQKCFELSIKINPYYEPAYRYLLLGAVKERDYKRSYEIIKKLLDLSSDIEKQDLNVFLILLSEVIDLDEEMCEYVKNLNHYDVMVSDVDYRFSEPYRISTNEVRSAIIKGKYSFAYAKQNKSNYSEYDTKDFDAICHSLLKGAINAQNERRDVINYLVSDGNYADLLNYLNKKDKHCRLRKSEKYFIKLAKEYLDIEETQIIPAKSEEITYNIFTAIYNKNYNLAHSLCFDDSEFIHIILKDICDVIKDVEVSYIDKLWDAIINKGEEEVLACVLECLINMDRYEYYPVIANLFRIRYRLNDNGFDYPIKFLEDIIYNKYIDEEELAECYDECVFLGQKELARAILPFINRKEEIILIKKKNKVINYCKNS